MDATQAHGAWREIAERALQAAPSQAFIDGRYVAAASGATFADVSPVDGRTLAEVAACDEADVAGAAIAARRAFDAGHWSNAAPAERKRVLLRLAELIDCHRDELAALETLDTGKPIADASGGDVPGAAGLVRWYAEAADKVYGEVAPTEARIWATITREPVGVVAAVVPWNFPLKMAMQKVAPALAAGNSVILKPAEQAPLSALRVAALAAEAGLPEGVFNVVPGLGETAGRALGLSHEVDCLAFTGSSDVGKLFLCYAGQSNMKRVQLECGGKSPQIVLSDCPDMRAAAKAIASGIFFNQGECCDAGSRLLVHAAVAEPLTEAILAEAESWTPGDPLDPATRLGAIIDEKQMRRVLGFVEGASLEGGRVRLGGRRVRQNSGGFYIEPTVFDAVRPPMALAREEVFGPVLAVLPFEDEDEAVRVANDSVYGLAAGVWSRDIDKALRLSKAVRAGTVWVNCFHEGDATVPFGGYKQSGIGRDKSLHALDTYTNLKTTWLRIGG